MKLVKSPFRLLTVATLAVALTAPMMISDAHADWRGNRGGYRHHRGGSDTGAYVALGLGAAALGGLLAYQATRPTYEAPPAYYAPPPPPATYYAPPPAAYYAPSPTPYYYSYSHPADAPYERPREWGN